MSSAINLHATKASNPFGSKKAVQILFAREAMASHRSEECERNDVHKHFHPVESMPWACWTVSQMRGPSIQSKWTEWGSWKDSLGSQIADGCFSNRMSRMVLVVVPSDEATLSRGSRPPLSWSVINRKAAFTFPSVVNLENRALSVSRPHPRSIIPVIYSQRCLNKYPISV